jgi:hypothetical protein
MITALNLEQKLNFPLKLPKQLSQPKNSIWFILMLIIKDKQVYSNGFVSLQLFVKSINSFTHKA